MLIASCSRACNSLLCYPRAFSGAAIAYPYKGQPRGADAQKEYSTSEVDEYSNFPILWSTFYMIPVTIHPDPQKAERIPRMWEFTANTELV